MQRKPAIVFPIIFSLSLVIAGLGILQSAEQGKYTPLDKRFYLGAKEAVWIRPGLRLEILEVSIPENRRTVVTFKITDDKGQGLDRQGNFTPGSVSTSFVLARIPANETQYVAYTTRTQRSPINGASALQASSDSGGTYFSLGDGIYTYTFGTVLPSNYDRKLTHTVGIYAARDLREFGLSRYVDNATHDFVPDGSPMTRIRQVVATENCNQCHNPLALHGGSRRDTRVCILCHTPQTTDPDTGNTVDFKVMIHKIHMGEHLPSVQAGKPYQIIGFGQSVHDFSTLAFPQDPQNCETCHRNAPQADNYRRNPTRAACGSCHDDVDFRTGANHLAGPQPDDTNCARCHWSEMSFEYDASVPGAHIAPHRSTQLKRPKFEVIHILDVGAGKNITVRFRITDKDGNVIAPSAMARLALRLAGPTTDYNWYVQETATGAPFENGIATYTFRAPLPANAKGTYSVGVEGYLNTTLNPGTIKQFSYRDAGDNVVKYFTLSGPLAPRRTVVEIAKCNKCHDKLQLHGNNRNDTEYCVGCHNPTLTDVNRRPASEGKPESAHFKTMIHKIHTGEELSDDFTVYGFGNRPHNYNELRFPGDRRDCTTCHVGNSYMLPLPSSAIASVTPRWFWTPTEPVAAACLSCHDTIWAAAHAFVNTAVFGESCVVCHKEGAEFAVSRMHAR